MKFKVGDYVKTNKLLGYGNPLKAVPIGTLCKIIAIETEYEFGPAAKLIGADTFNWSSDCCLLIHLKLDNSSTIREKLGIK